ncbi:MAG: hypothetical protein GY869_11330 [Planctomycetes bacterium]|nr:hypothetical protein [Planctomycetota bacterium]
MNQNKQNKPQPTPSQGFTDDLSAIFTPPNQIPLDIDQKIIDQSRQHFRKHRNNKPLWLKLTSAASIAAAALLIISLTITPDAQYSATPEPEMVYNQPVALRADLDQSGSIDILDAFYLARQIDNNPNLLPQWDLNNDGAINRTDVDLIAHAAVRLKKEVL